MVCDSGFVSVNAGIEIPVDARAGFDFPKLLLLPKSGTTWLPKRLDSGTRNGTATAMTVHVVPPKVEGNSMNPET